MGDARRLYDHIRRRAPLNLRLIHHSLATVTGKGEKTEPRLKYVELWFSTGWEDRWERRVSSGGESAGPTQA